VLRRVVDVRPVDQRGDAGVEALERAGQVGRVHVLRAVYGRERVEDLDEVVIEGGIGGDVADRRLPGVPVGVDEAGDDDGAGRVDDLRVGVERRSDRHDRVTVDEHIRLRKLGLGRVSGEDVSTTDEDLGQGRLLGAEG